MKKKKHGLAQDIENLITLELNNGTDLNNSIITVLLKLLSILSSNMVPEQSRAIRKQVHQLLEPTNSND